MVRFQVHGYVLISMVFSQYIPLTSLRLIRGLSLFKPRGLPLDDDVEAGCSLCVLGNSHGAYGIHELQLPELRGKNVLMIDSKGVEEYILTQDHALLEYRG
jgi:hypothetical protein